eukprot:gene2185-2326_t
MKIRQVLEGAIPEIDEEILSYFDSLIDTNSVTKESLKEVLLPFIESYGLSKGSEDASTICDRLIQGVEGLALYEEKYDDLPQLLDKAIILSDVTKTHLSKEEQATVDNLWGFENVRKNRNTTLEFSEAASQKYERKAAKEQRKWLEELESQFVGEEDNNKVSTMMLPDYSAGTKEKDIHVHNFNITYGGKLLLESADLNIVYGRRYGLIGKNGIGKTTLLKHMATFNIEGFPRHHRVLHVKQEVKSSTDTVLQVVLESDIERITLLDKEKELNEKLKDINNTKEIQIAMKELEDLHERLELIGADSAEARAASILSGLQFTEEMQKQSTDSLSGGWRMRVAIAAALFIEPDLLMLDEPTNHLDLEAVLWLEKYLKSYPNTILLVSHDRAFLNEVCTDIVLFEKLKLFYHRGNYDSYEKNREEMRVVQQKQYEAQQIKLQHMQEFVDKFRYNAKRASLVQSRIKQIEKQILIEKIEDEEEFEFEFYDSGQLGRPIIAIEGVTFGFNSLVTGKRLEALFKDVHLNIDQSSRVALVGPNGAGKSTLLKLIQGKYQSWDGVVRINPQLRIGIFTQHHMDSFDLTISPLQNLMNQFPSSNEAELRAHLGRFQVTGGDALKPMKFSSGGQKSRVAFASLTFTKPHVVIMDEPSNHLDMQAIQALIHSLQNFTGGVLVVSHDEHFIKSVCNEIWMIGNRTVKQFNGNFDDYKKLVLGNIPTTNIQYGGKK